MIFSCDEPCEIGEIVHPCWIAYFGQMIAGQPLFVLRDASRDEWAREIRDAGYNPEEFKAQPYFYEVSLD